MRPEKTYPRGPKPYKEYEPLPLHLPIPEPFSHGPRPSEKKEKISERGVWITEI